MPIRRGREINDEPRQSHASHHRAEPRERRDRRRLTKRLNRRPRRADVGASDKPRQR